MLLEFERERRFMDKIQISTEKGMSNAIDSGMAKLRIEEAAAKKQARIDSGEDIIVGVNKFELDASEVEETEVLHIDNSAVRKSQMDNIKRIKAERDNAKCSAALKGIVMCSVVL